MSWAINDGTYTCNEKDIQFRLNEFSLSSRNEDVRLTSNELLLKAQIYKIIKLVFNFDLMWTSINHFTLSYFTPIVIACVDLLITHLNAKIVINCQMALISNICNFLWSLFIHAAGLFNSSFLIHHFHSSRKSNARRYLFVLLWGIN